MFDNRYPLKKVYVYEIYEAFYVIKESKFVLRRKWLDISSNPHMMDALLLYICCVFSLM